MDEARAVLIRDLEILAHMVEELPDYLAGDATPWTMSAPDLPPLTLGGLLMRRDRLTILRDRLAAEPQERLGALLQRFSALLVDNVVRLERRAGQELRSRLSEWSGYLRAAGSLAAADPAYYARVVDTRIVIAATTDFMADPPYRLDAGIYGEIDQLDRHLRGRWQDGPFVWDVVWQPAYPVERYWWMYGHPRLTG